MELEVYLIYIAVVLLLGTLCSALAYQLKTSNVFFLILVGMVLGAFGVLSFPREAVITIATIALILVIFDSSHKFSIEQFISKSIFAGKLITLFFFMNLAVMSVSMKYLFSIPWLPAILFSTIIYGIDPMIALSMLKGKTHDVIDILKVESIINTPLTLIIPFLILGMMSNVESGIKDTIVPFIQQIILGIGVGIIVGSIVILILKHNYLGDLSHLTLLTSAIITYVGAEAISGNGILAIATFGLIFGNTRVHHKVELENFASIFSYTLEILVFIMMGAYLLIRPEYILRGSMLFCIYLAVRFASVSISFPGFPMKHKLFMSLNVPKGIDVAIVVLFLISAFSGYGGIEPVINTILLFILYSIVLSTIVSLFSDHLFKDQHPKHKSRAVHRLLGAPSNR